MKTQIFTGHHYSGEPCSCGGTLEAYEIGGVWVLGCDNCEKVYK